MAGSERYEQLIAFLNSNLPQPVTQQEFANGDIQFTGGDPGILENLRKLYADQANWPSTSQKPFSDEAGAFIGKAVAARKSKAEG